MNTTLSWYGSDPTGFVCGYVFSPEGKGRPLDSQATAAWLSGRTSDAEFIWLHFHLGNAGAEKWLRAHLDISNLFFDNLAESSRTTRIEYAGEELIATINDVAYDFSFEPSEIKTLWLTVDQRKLVSVRRQPLKSIDKLRLAVKEGASFRSPLALLVHLLGDQADVLAQIMREVAVRVDGIEDDHLAARLDPKRARLSALRRVLVRLQRLLAPEPAALFRLLNRPPAWIGEQDVQELRQSTEEFAAVLSDVRGLQERIKLLQEEIAAMVAERTSRSVFVLTAVTVLALPINIMAGLFGMNVGGIPFAASDSGFWIVVAVVITFTALAAWIALHRRGD